MMNSTFQLSMSTRDVSEGKRERERERERSEDNPRAITVCSRSMLLKYLRLSSLFGRADGDGNTNIDVKGD